MYLKLAYKPEDFGPDAPHVALQVTRGPLAGTYGVYVSTGPKGTVRAVGSGRGCSLAEATASVDRYNRELRTAKDCG